MMGSPLLISFFVFLQLLAILAHARTLSENSLNAFRQTNHLEMPSSLSSPFPAAGEITPDSSSCQMKKPSPPSPPPPHTPYGPGPITRPSYLAEWFGSWFTPITTEGLCNIFRNRMDSKKAISSTPPPPPPPPLKPNIRVASRQNPHPSQYELTFIMI